MIPPTPDLRAVAIPASQLCDYDIMVREIYGSHPRLEVVMVWGLEIRSGGSINHGDGKGWVPTDDQVHGFYSGGNGLHLDLDKQVTVYRPIVEPSG